jgi:hypothetical protein
MLYQRGNPAGFEAAKKSFSDFMSGYRFSGDVEAILTIISKEGELSADSLKLLELYAKKIALVRKEDFTAVEDVRKDIERLRRADGAEQ